ncbi:uncharacterized protein LOC115928135 [Strongylocentrotus purpuratus]|uniref:Uncharacterized protein n=1 Tax=Strongylocentrotus purpuratus TaxID=7668 RepID=A0A7M7PHJ3_STRPU|nr:uncharacterized protein LOC115919148 [Strongylocentrotus purpuratus]XP_030850774.1 uncharacterized protein LOC115928135 [Strongylocentrotus purpuratus]
MPKFTKKEKQRHYIEKMKRMGKYEEYLKKKAAAMKRCREKQKLRERTLPKYARKQLERETKEATKKRVAKHRKLKKERKAEAEAEASHGPFKSAMALAKATARAHRIMDRVLPDTPKRRIVVSRKLYEKEAKQGHELPSASAEKRKTGPPKVSEDTVKVIEDFYERDDVSRQAPGRKDVVTIWNADGKKKMQARHLTASIKETYAFFCEIYPEVHVGKSKFAECRPKHVLLSQKLPHNVCLCRYHENAINAFTALHKAQPEFPAYTRDLPALLLCKQPSRECWMNECAECKDGAGFSKAFSFEGSLNSPCSWLQWETDKDGRMMKIQEEGTVGELVQHITAILPQFLQHCYVKREQASAYNAQREKVSPESHDTHSALLQVDFSENFTCVAQDEVQSAHWNQRQVSLFTAALWYSGSLHSHILASDDLTHSKETIIAYLDVLLGYLPDTVTSISIWSDGPASQFKNRFVAAALCTLQEAHKIQIKWNFFSTSHGKGPVDGIGGSAKRFVMQRVLSRQDIVADASSFVLAASFMENVCVTEVKSTEIAKRNEKLKLKDVFIQAKPITGIGKMHFLKVVKDEVVSHILTKDNRADKDDVVVTQSGSKAIVVGDWYVVEYEGKKFPGEVVGFTRKGEFQVSVMEPVGKYWKWPTKKDAIFYMESKMITKLAPPEVVNNRGHFKF